MIFFQPPKYDRPGRLAYQGTILDADKEVNEITVEFVIGVPDHKGRLTVQAAISAKKDIPASDCEDFGSDLEVMLGNLVKWSERHD